MNGTETFAHTLTGICKWVVNLKYRLPSGQKRAWQDINKQEEGGENRAAINPVNRKFLLT